MRLSLDTFSQLFIHITWKEFMTELFLFLNQFGDISRPGEYNNCLERGGLYVRHQNLFCVFSSHVTDRDGYWMLDFQKSPSSDFIWRSRSAASRSRKARSLGKRSTCSKSNWMWMLREKEDRSLTVASTEHFLPVLTIILFIYSLMILCVGLEEVLWLQLWACVHIARYKNFKVHVLS